MQISKIFICWLACSALALIAAGCGSSQSSSSFLDDKDDQPVFNANVETSLQNLLYDHVGFSGEAGISLSVSIGDDKKWHGVSGLADIRSNAPMGKGAHFRAGSNTKMFMAAIVMQMVEEGKIKLEEPLSKYFPEYEKWKDITIKQLLGMRSGIPEYFKSKWLWMAALWNPTRKFTPKKLLSYVENDALEFQPGDGCAYSNSNTILLGMIIEQLTGQKLVDVLNERVIDPIGLENTYLDMGDREDNQLAHGYLDAILSSAVMDIPQLLFGFVRREHFVGDNLVDATRLFHPSTTWAAGGIVSSTDDMTKFVKALFQGAVVSDESLATMKKVEPCTVLNMTYQYGLGLMRHPSPFGDAYGHGGLTFGYKTETFYVPEVKVAWSEMSGWFPEQTAIINKEILKVAVEGADEPIVSCQAPEGFFSPLTGSDDWLDLRFRGPINAPGNEVPGTANFTARLAGQRNPYFGLVSHAQLKPVGDTGRLETVSIAPTSNKRLIKMASTSISYEALKGLTGDSMLKINAEDKLSSLVFLADVTLSSANKKPEKMCITAVPDFTREGKISVCNSEQLQLEPGRQFRMFGRVPLTTVQTDIEAFVATLELERCMCFNDAGEMEPCSDPE